MAFSRKDPRASRSDDERPGTPLHRDNVPGELEHASGESDQFDAAIVAGADGRPLNPEIAGMIEATEADLDRQAVESYAVPRTNVDAGTSTPKGVGRFAGFIRASWAELQRVQWPDRRQVGQATAVVLGFVVIAGLYLGLADYVAQKLVDFIL